MKKLITIMACVICLALVVSVAALGNDINVFESLSSFKYKASEIDTRLDNNLENPEEYQKAMNESLALFNDPQYEKIAEQMVKEQEASREYLKSLKKFHFVLPAARSTFSNESHFVLYPTQLIIPFEKRLYSETCKTESATCLVIRRKSLAPLLNSVLEILLIILSASADKI